MKHNENWWITFEYDFTLMECWDDDEDEINYGYTCYDQ